MMPLTLDAQLAMLRGPRAAGISANKKGGDRVARQATALLSIGTSSHRIEDALKLALSDAGPGTPLSTGTRLITGSESYIGMHSYAPEILGKYSISVKKRD